MNVPSPARPPVRIGAVGYLNARPLVWGLEHGRGAGRIELFHATPARVAERMAAGDAELGLLPVIELARIPGLEIVPGLGITTNGPARSVLLVARRPLAQIESVALDPESRTSNALVQVLFADVWGRRPAFHVGPLEFEAALASADAAVRIGDKALFEPPPDGVEVHDLGQAWTAATGLPFVFAAWAARPGVVDRELYNMLHASRRDGTAALDAIAEGYVWNGRSWPELSREYLRRNIVYRLGAAEVRGLELFLAAAARCGLIDAAPPIRLALSRWTGCHEAAATKGMITR